MAVTKIPGLLFFSLCFLASTHARVNGRLFKGKWFGSTWTKSGTRSNGGSSVETYWFNQTLDHFNPSDTRTWAQRYFMNDTFYKAGGPVFLMIGGEGEDNPLWMSQGAWITYAQKLNALCFSLEHRFYGKSHPTPDLSTENLVYLTSEQALADLAQFTQGMTELHKLQGSKWVAFGGSYPGSLAAWYRLKYPHLVHAAVSTSAPLHAKINFKEYLGVVQDSLNRTNPQCVSQIEKATHSMQLLLKRRTGWWMLRKNFKICGDFQGDNSKDVSNFFETTAGNFMDIVQYNEDNRAFEGSPTANITINTLCDLMTSGDLDDPSPMTRYAQVNDLLLQAYGKNCTDIDYRKMIKEMKQTEWGSSVAGGARQWTFQTCTEFGFFQTSELPGQPFGQEFPLEFSVRQCQDIFGPNFVEFVHFGFYDTNLNEFPPSSFQNLHAFAFGLNFDLFSLFKYDQNFISKGIDWTNTNYGGRALKVTRVIFVNGSIDPWHALGLTNATDTSTDNKVIFIDGTAHCANMYPDAPSDVPQLRQARAQILEFLKEQLQKE